MRDKLIFQMIQHVCRYKKYARRITESEREKHWLILTTKLLEMKISIIRWNNPNLRRKENLALNKLSIGHI